MKWLSQNQKKKKQKKKNASPVLINTLKVFQLWFDVACKMYQLQNKSVK